MNMNADTPTISSSNYGQAGPAGPAGSAALQSWAMMEQPHGGIAELLNVKQQIEMETPMPNSIRRMVQVFIADTNENVPLDQALLYRGEPKLTDLNDTELYFEIGLTSVLVAHNEKRIKLLDKEASKRAGKDIYLDPVRIRDLKMLVITLANFG